MRRWCRLTTLINNIRQTLVDALDWLIPERARCALIDFPAHPNVGDSAIWLGERADLRQRGVTGRLHLRRQELLQVPFGTYLSAKVRFLIHGGGNFGDLWPHHHALRLKVLRDFPRQRIIQLPQWIHFERSSALDESKRVIDAHAHFVMMTRDRQSFEIFTRHFSQPCHLAPDGAFGLGPQEVSGTPSSEFFWLKRLDKESLGSTGPELLNGIPARTGFRIVPAFSRSRRCSALRRNVLFA